MSFEDSREQSEPKRQSGSNLLAGNPAWKRGGPSPNPGGRPAKMQACREAIEGARDPKKVGRLLDALYDAGIAGDISAAKTWLAYTCGPPPRDADDLDLDEGGTPLPPLESTG